jgi:hypothetical protein
LIPRERSGAVLRTEFYRNLRNGKAEVRQTGLSPLMARATEWMK